MTDGSNRKPRVPAPNCRGMIHEPAKRRPAARPSTWIKGPEAARDAWLRRHEGAVREPVRPEDDVPDVNTTVKPL